MNHENADRRSYQRHAVRLLIDYEAKDSFKSDYTTDISGGGLFIQTHAPLLIGTEMELKIAFPRIPKFIEIKGVVVWINENPTSNKPPGMGIKFIGLKEEDRRFIDSLAQPDME